MHNALMRIFGDKSLKPRKLVLLILSAIMMISSIFVFSNNAFAAGDALWSDEKFTSIYYEKNNYIKASDSDKKKFSGVKGKNIFIYYGTNSKNGKTDAFLISVDKLEKNTEGEFHKYSLYMGGKSTKEAEPEKIKIGEVSEGSSESCAVEGGGGWMVCTVAGTLASAMDGLFGILQNLLDVKPMEFDNKAPLFRVWDYMRNIANVLFVIFFIVVIYSQITNVGISNYGIKKMLPKLIVAAIMINLSYYICAILVDLSNILGNQIQNMLVGIRTNIFEDPSSSITADTLSWMDMTWAKVTAAAMAGGVGVTAGVALGGSGAVLWLIFCGLISVFFSALVAIIILAARQAIITIMIFLAPLAFAAGVLPNTEKWFEKWKDLFSTMLIMYPMFSILFGGAQLAGTIVIATAGSNPVTNILGMIIQIVPLAITPFLIKLSGGLLGRFAGMVNNPNKGPFDAAKNFARNKAAMSRNQKIESGFRPENLTKKGRPRYGNTAWMAQMGHNRKQKLDQQGRITESLQKKSFLDQDSKYIQSAQKSNDPKYRDEMLAKSYQFREDSVKGQLEFSEESMKNAMSGLKATIAKETFTYDLKGKITGVDKDKAENLSRNLGNYSAALYNTMNETNAAKLANANNSALSTRYLAETLKDSPDLLDKSAGVRGEEGKYMALANSFANAGKIKNEEVSSLNSLMKHYEFSAADQANVLHGKKVAMEGGQIEKDVEGNVIFEKDTNGNEIKIDSITKGGMNFKSTDNLKEAAVKDYMARSTVSEAMNILEQTDGNLHGIKAAAAQGWTDSGKKADAPWVGAGFLDQVATTGVGKGAAHSALIDGFNKKISDKSIMEGNNESLQLLHDAITKSHSMASTSSTIDNTTIQTAIKTFMNINSDPQKFAKINPVQGKEIHKIIEYVKKNSSPIYEKAISEALSELKRSSPKADRSNLDENFLNIKKPEEE